MTEPLWQPSEHQSSNANITILRETLAAQYQLDLPDYTALHAWSAQNPEPFWTAIWEQCGVIGDMGARPFLVDGDRMPGARWFPQARLSFAENLLRRRDDGDAIVFWGEDQVKRRMSYAELQQRVSQVRQALEAMGVGKGDRVAGYLPNMPETVVAMLATTSLGAIWSSSSPDFGVNGVVDRFGQIEPKVLFAADGYHYNGKSHDSLKKLADIRQRIPCLQRVVVVPYIEHQPDVSGVEDAVTLNAFADGYTPGEIDFLRVPFDHPLYIMFSSGTTGVPKCIIHGAGGTLLQHLKEHRYHCDVRRDDRIFYFPTCGWMMWHWLVSGLASDATLLRSDGSPFHTSGNLLCD